MENLQTYRLLIFIINGLIFIYLFIYAYSIFLSSITLTMSTYTIVYFNNNLLFTNYCTSFWSIKAFIILLLFFTYKIHYSFDNSWRTIKLSTFQRNENTESFFRYLQLNNLSNSLVH